jgi:ABC-type lipoprotein export system ATPase subunit
MSQPSVQFAKPLASSVPILSFVDVFKDYISEGAVVRALDGINLDIDPGSFVALVGRSGCGKSTLLHLAGALDFPTAGTVHIEGSVTSRLNEDGLTRLRRKQVGFVFQSFQLLNTLSVIENIEVPLLLAGDTDPRNRAMEQLGMVDLDGLAHRMTHQLSGGQLQRVAIARALVHNPTLLLADEPTGNLDTATGNTILSLLRRICTERGVTILMATHSAEAAAIADATVHMRDGRIIEGPA